MQIVNFEPVTVTAGGDVIVTSEQANKALSMGLTCVIIATDVEIKLIDSSDGQNWADIPNAVAGTAANSPISIAANSSDVVLHRGGAIKGISTGANATVTFAFGVAP